MNDFAKLIPELSQWNAGGGISAESWISCLGNYEHAIAYGCLFWPEFVEHDNCIFRADGFDRKNYEAWLKQTKGDKTATERVLNHQHLVDFFPNASEPTKAQIIYLGSLLRELWECKLRRDFPAHSVSVYFFDGDSEDCYEYVITFYQVR